MRRGFLTKAQATPAEAPAASPPRAEASRPPVRVASLLEQAKASREEEQPSGAQASCSSRGEAPDRGAATPQRFVEGVRARLRAAAEAAAQRRAAAAAAEGEAHGLAGLLAPLRARARWPSAQARSAREKATAEMDGSLAEVRAALNDARRLRSGEERRAVSDLRRAVEEMADRVKRAAEAVAPGSASKEGHGEEEAIGAFHGMPLAVKLRILADERVAMAVLGASFLAGMATMWALAAELYSVWHCSWQC